MKQRKADDTYLFGKDMLFTFKYVFPLFGLILCCIAFVFFLQVILPSEDRGAGIFATAIFIAMGMFFILFSRKFVNIFATQYILSENTVSNCGKVSTSASTQLPLFVCLLPLSYAPKGVIIKHPVYLVSNTPIAYIPRYQTESLGLAKNAMELGIVVLPVNDKTTAWIQQATSITPPEYPKVAYVQNKQ